MLMTRQKLLSIVGLSLGLLLFSAMLWVLHRELQQYHYHDIVSPCSGNSWPAYCSGVAADRSELPRV